MTRAGVTGTTARKTATAARIGQRTGGLTMHEELIGKLDLVASVVRSKDLRDLLKQAADAIEAMNYELKSLYKLLGTHSDPRGENGEAGVKCIDCQRDCQMIGLDMPACTAYCPYSKREETEEGET